LFKFVSKTMKGNETRDMIFYLYSKQSSTLHSMFLSTKLNLTGKSCGKIRERVELHLKLDTFYEIQNENWFPIYVDNARWSHVEFVCEIEVKIMTLNDPSTFSKEHKHVRI